VTPFSGLRFEGVSFSYPGDVLALREITLGIREGESVAILGENGAGKTTLVKHLNGLLRPSRGRVLVGDWDTREHTAAQLARRVGYVFQNPDDQLFERTVRAEVAFGPRNLGRSQIEIDTAVSTALAQVGLEAQAEQHPYDLHVSQRKLLALAAVLAMETPVVVLDEPTTGQDTRGLARIGEVVEALKSEGQTVIVISHDVDFCAEHSERCILMSGGRVLADGPSREVLAKPGLLAEAAVERPQLARLAAALELPGTPLTEERFIEALALVRKCGDHAEADRSSGKTDETRETRHE
jgi:energy-coupling factor transport system ATP-binding protein